MAIIRLEEQTGYKDWLKNTNSSWQYDASIQATTDENPFIYLTNTGENDAVFQIALSKLVDIQLIRKNSILVTPSILDKAKGIKVELRDQSQNVLATSKASLNSKTWIHLLANAENIALDITELWIIFVLPAGASTVIAGVQGQILTQDQTVVDSMKVEATDGDTAIDLTQAKLNASKYFVKFAPESWWRADGVLKAKQLLTVDPLDITVNVAEAMNKTFYVDAVNGDDNNDGSESAPFKTIEKAIQSIPTGGFGRIFINGTVETQQNLEIKNKYINVRLDNGKLVFKSYVRTIGSSSYNAVFGWDIYGATVSFEASHPQNIPFIVVDNSVFDSNNINHSAWMGALRVCGVSKVLFWSYGDEGQAGNPLLQVGSEGYKFVTMTGLTEGGAIFVPIFMFSMRIQDGGYFEIQSGSYMFHIKGLGLLSLLDSSEHFDGIRNESGNNLEWSDVIEGIIKDANGVPRNIVSTIVF